MPKTLILIYVALFLLICTISLTLFGEDLPRFGCMYKDDLELFIENTINEDERHTGLSGRANILDNYGMMFNFPDALGDWHNMWMKDMNFSLDFIAMDKDFVVTSLNKHVPPCEKECEAFSIGPCRHIIEVKAGTIDRYHIRIGDQFRWTSNKACQNQAN